MSFCIPVYNKAEIAAKIVKGLLVSDDTRFEVVISDNASSDDTREVIAGIHDARLKYYRNDTNIGAKLNWLKALELGQGEYLYLGIGRDFLHGENITRLIELLANARENDVTFMKDRNCDTDFRIYDGIDAMIRFIEWDHPTGIIINRATFLNIPNLKYYYEISDSQPECYVMYHAMINHKGAVVNAGVWTWDFLVDYAKVRSTFEEGVVREIYYSLHRRTIQFFEFIDMIDDTPAEIFTDYDKDKFFGVKFAALLLAVSLKLRVLCKSNEQAHYGHETRNVGVREMIENILTANKDVASHLNERGKYTITRQKIMNRCRTKAIVNIFYVPTRDFVRRTAKRILQPLGIWQILKAVKNFIRRKI